MFWERWRREYLPNLSVRPKWTTESRNLEEGDVVLVMEPNVAETTGLLLELSKFIQVVMEESERLRSRPKVDFLCDRLQSYVFSRKQQ